MPREVKAYSCSFGCGRRVQTSKSVVEKHEKTCAMNPERRACKLCKHKSHRVIGKHDVIKSADVYEPTCMISKMPYGSKMHFDCEHWEPRDY